MNYLQLFRSLLYLLIICDTTILLSGCGKRNMSNAKLIEIYSNTELPKNVGKEVSIIGKALNSKLSPVIALNGDFPVYIKYSDNKHEWPTDLEGHIIRAVGNLRWIEIEHKQDEIPDQTIVGSGLYRLEVLSVTRFDDNPSTSTSRF